MEVNLLKLKPCSDTFFKDGQQFNFNMNEVITSKNTPYPSVFFGAIFTSILTNNDQFREEFFRKRCFDHEKILKIGQVYLFNDKKDKLYIKCPLDLFYYNKRDSVKFGKFQKNNKLTSISCDYILKSPNDEKYERADSKYIEFEYSLYSYANCKNNNIIQLLDEKDIFKKNYKVGIGIDKLNRVVSEGMLYKVEQIEFANNMWSYIVEYKIDWEYLRSNYKDIKENDLKKGYLKLGGENKVCSYTKIYNEVIQKFNSKKNKEIDKGIYKLIFTSPTYFKKGIYEIFKQYDVEVLGICNSKPIYIGGYDMQTKYNKGRVRQMYKGYGEGTVLLIKNNKKQNLYTSINDNNKGFNECVIIREDEKYES